MAQQQTFDFTGWTAAQKTQVNGAIAFLASKDVFKLARFYFRASDAKREDLKTHNPTLKKLFEFLESL